MPPPSCRINTCMYKCCENNYVYTLSTPSGVIFYVGIGAVTARCRLGFRIDRHIKEAMTSIRDGYKPEANIAKLEIIKSIILAGQTVGSSIIASNLSRDQANALEIKMIYDLGRSDLGKGNLTNRNNGGSGSKAPSAATREKIGNASRGKIVSEETRNRQSKSRQGRKINQEWRDKISASLRDKPHTDAHNHRVGLATRSRWTDPLYRGKITAKLRKKWLVIYPDGHEEVHHGLQDIISNHPHLKMSSLSQSGKKGKSYKGFIATLLELSIPLDQPQS